MNQHKYREQHYKRSEERTKVNIVVLRFFLNALLITIAGTATVAATQLPVAALVTVGSAVIILISIVCYVIWLNIDKDINNY